MFFQAEEQSTKTTIPFVKGNEFDYADLITWINPEWSKYAWIIFILASIFIITAVSNGANLTDGIDGLAAGTSAIICTYLRDICFCFGTYYVFRLSEYHVHSKD